jgi:predicted branched-subunit amino acid permease
MQLGFKCAFWLSLIVLVISTWTMRYPYTPDLIAAGLALSGFLIKNRAYKILATVIVCFALRQAWYSDWLINNDAWYN